MDLTASPHVAAAGALVQGAHLLVASPDPPPIGFLVYATGVVFGLGVIALSRLRRPNVRRPPDLKFDVVRRRFHHGEIDLAEAERQRKELQGD